MQFDVSSFISNSCKYFLPYNRCSACFDFLFLTLTPIYLHLTNTKMQSKSYAPSFITRHFVFSFFTKHLFTPLIFFFFFYEGLQILMYMVGGLNVECFEKVVCLEILKFYLLTSIFWTINYSVNGCFSTSKACSRSIVT